MGRAGEAAPAVQPDKLNDTVALHRSAGRGYAATANMQTE